MKLRYKLLLSACVLAVIAFNSLGAEKGDVHGQTTKYPEGSTTIREMEMVETVPEDMPLPHVIYNLEKGTVTELIIEESSREYLYASESSAKRK